MRKVITCFLLLGSILALSCSDKEPQKVPLKILAESISLDLLSMQLTIGESAELVATVLPVDADDKGVVWTSDNESVAVVDKGRVSGVGVGTATITASSSVSGLTAACKVTVHPDLVPVVGITLDQKTLLIDVGEKSTLTATLTPSDATDRRVIWTSDRESVATVVEGVVTAVSVGSAIITAESQDGALTATCSVVVGSFEVGELVGEWKLSTWAASPGMAGRVWLKFNADKTFALYQIVGSVGYTRFSGSYAYDVVGRVLAGVYSDGVAWAKTYDVQSLSAEQIILVDKLHADDVSIYVREAIPDYVKNSMTVKSSRVTAGRFL